MKVSALAEKAVYGIITHEDVRQICQERLLYADLLSRSPYPRMAHAAKMVKATVEAIEIELLGRIS